MKNYLFNFILILFQIVKEISFCSNFASKRPFNGPEIFKINPSDLDIYFFQVSVTALFKAKSKIILKTLPNTERIVFNQCLEESKNKLNLMAKCLVSLFNIRDNYFKLKNIKLNENNNKEKEELPFWREFIKFNNFSKILLNNSLNNLKSKTTKIQRNFAVFANLMEEKEEKKLKKIRQKFKQKSKKEIIIRRKRNLKNIDEKTLEKFPNVKQIVQIENFYNKVERCENYIQQKDRILNRLLQNSGFSVQLKSESFQHNPLIVAESQLRNILNFDEIKILSPRLLSIIPENQKNKNISKIEEMLMSPTFFSFHEDGNFSIKQLLDLVFTNNKEETLPWLELLLQISGAAKTLNNLLLQLEPIKRRIETKILPSIESLEELDKRFDIISSWYNKRQKEALETRGYTHLNKGQLMMMFNGNGKDKISQKLIEDLSDDENEMEEILEEDIKILSKINENDYNLFKYLNKKNFLNRTKRQSLDQLRLLNPDFFVNQVNNGAIINSVALSPSAFEAAILEPNFGSFPVLSPTAFISSILSPRAAIANILSPNAFTTEILTPQAFNFEVLAPKTFNAKVLSPRAFTAYVLSPRAIVARILSPKAFDFRVLNPTFIYFSVLSPEMLKVSIASSQNYALVVLSPNILSVGFLNEGKGNIRILSPKILSGPTKK
ncbi:hypothetical protein Mgra_00001069 [Meloidogyne graminicola]|uniref:Uncharacterized protein n=1 Tax=Meloidogyne graminicola TaxID=189291 RepID=A0A8T0A281_9BILA|nr:hypothetical protein Mgra_00001069 [Meloidogyne graminicola]